jgi:hypothetical protein
MAACSNGHIDIVKRLLAIPFLNVHVADVSCVSGKRLCALFSHRRVHCESEVW